MIKKHKKPAFTIVELLTVLLVITILVALLLPALSMVRRMAKETQQKAQLTTIEMALTAFRNDYGDYPPSGDMEATPTDYTGAQRLSEALVGYDLLGFHPDSGWDETGSEYPTSPTPAELKERVEPYLERATANVFRLGNSSASEHDGLFDDVDPGALEGDTYVLCDVFTIRRISLASGDIVKAGTPVLYYRANTASKSYDPNTTPDPEDRIYNFEDNFELVDLGSLTADGSAGESHPLAGEALYKSDREGGITDSKITEIPWPHRPDSYILISAGADGLYGTKDDIRNF